MQIVWVAEVINSFKHASRNKSINSTELFLFYRKKQETHNTAIEAGEHQSEDN